MERDRLVSALSQNGEAGEIFLDTTRIALCGFGLVAAAAMTMRHLNQFRPQRVILAGIAGSLGPECELGSAYWFSHVVCDGIGVGSEQTFLSATTLGWNHVDEDPSGASIGDCLGLHRPCSNEEAQFHFGLISRCAASADAASAGAARKRAERILRQEGAAASLKVAAEDMEGFAVALACRIAGVNLSIVRGVSNTAGERNHASWKINDAIESISQKLLATDFINRVS